MWQGSLQKKNFITLISYLSICCHYFYRLWPCHIIAIAASANLYFGEKWWKRGFYCKVKQILVHANCIYYIMQLIYIFPEQILASYYLLEGLIVIIPYCYPHSITEHSIWPHLSLSTGDMHVGTNPWLTEFPAELQSTSLVSLLRIIEQRFVLTGSPIKTGAYLLYRFDISIYFWIDFTLWHLVYCFSFGYIAGGCISIYWKCCSNSHIKVILFLSVLSE